MEVTVEFEKLLALSNLQASNTMPKSVRMRYDNRLAVLRGALQEQRHAYPLGAILVSIGAVTDKQLNRALRAQRLSEPKKLLGEFLVEMNITTGEQLSHALAIQARTSSRISYSPLRDARTYADKEQMRKA